jgi:hypothetical protein
MLATPRFSSAFRESKNVSSETLGTGRSAGFRMVGGA